MKLLLDQNLSHRLVDSLVDLYPGSLHVRALGLSQALDEAVWEFAGAHELAIVTKDGDFSSRAFLFGPSPKVVWIQLGNCSTQEIADLLRARHSDLASFHDDGAAGLLILP